jgi:hypothetical protein
MSHERGFLPVPPSEFVCLDLADPKIRFCRSPASTLRTSMTACLTFKQIIDTMTLIDLVRHEFGMNAS